MDTEVDPCPYPERASVSSDRRAYEASDQYLRAIFLIPDLS